MTIKELKKKILDALKNQEMILNIFDYEKSLLINCRDESSFFINILESDIKFTHNDYDDEVNKYLATHSEKDFAADLLEVMKGHPAFFLYFMLFTKLKEKEIIDTGLFYHIMDNIILCEAEFEELITKLLIRYKNDVT